MHNEDTTHPDHHAKKNQILLVGQNPCQKKVTFQSKKPIKLVENPCQKKVALGRRNPLSWSQIPVKWVKILEKGKKSLK